MAGLTVNGVSVPALMDRGVTRSAPELIGPAEERSFQGDLLSAVRARKEVLDVRLSLQDSATATAWRRFLVGAGHSWSFDDATFGQYSSRGLAPAIQGLLGTTAPAPKYGARRLAVAGTVSWLRVTPQNYSLGDDGWSVLVWRWTGSAWAHHVVRDDYQRWLNGVASLVATPWLDYLDPQKNLQLYDGATWESTFIGPYAGGVIYQEGERARVTVGPTTYVWRCVFADDPSSDGVGGGLAGGSPGLLQNDDNADATYVFVLEGTDPGVGAGSTFVDDLVFLPFRLPATWVAELYAEHATRPWSALPAVRVTGEALDGRAVYMEGQLQDAGIRPAVINGAWSQGVQDVGAILREV